MRLGQGEDPRPERNVPIKPKIIEIRVSESGLALVTDSGMSKQSASPVIPMDPKTRIPNTFRQRCFMLNPGNPSDVFSLGSDFIEMATPSFRKNNQKPDKRYLPKPSDP